MRPSVSVVIPTYNRGLSIGRAIDSILEGTLIPDEIIVVDDGSIDNTQEILKAYESRIKYIFQKNAGVSAARNRGIQAAGAEWIAFLDSDDEWFQDYLMCQIECVEKNPTVLVHIANAITIHPDGQEENHFFGTRLMNRFRGEASMILSRPLASIAQYAPWFVQSTIMRRKELLECGLFDAQLRIGEDFDLLARMSCKGSFCIHSRALVRINRNDELFDHLTRQADEDRVKTIETWAQVIMRLKNIETLNRAEKTALARFLSSNRRALANIMLETGQRRRAKKLFREAFLIHPDAKSFLKFITSHLF